MRSKQIALDRFPLAASRIIGDSEEANKQGASEPRGSHRRLDDSLDMAEQPKSEGEHKIVDVIEHLACDDILWYPHTTFQVKPESLIQCLTLVTNGEQDKAKWSVWGGDHGGMIHMWNAKVYLLIPSLSLSLSL